ncbi:MAG: carboxypeptidase-like regulatory domain-containing protein, partial [Ginsengibacter sp.]
MIKSFIKIKRVLCLWALFILLFAAKVLGQTSSDNLVTGNFNEATFDAFVKKVEAQTTFHFYYNPAWFDSITITISANKAYLSSVLDKILGKTNWHYTIDDENHVFITKGFTLAKELPYGFFNDKTDTAESTAKNEQHISPYINQAKKAPPEISIENKLFDIGVRRNDIAKGNVNIAGYIRDAQTGESLSGALIYLDHLHVQVNSDQFGYYALTLPAGRHTLNIISPGMFDTKRQVMLYSDGKF